MSVEFDPAEVLLRLERVLQMTSLSRATVYRLMNELRFPKPLKLSEGGRVAWRGTDVASWIADPLGWGRKVQRDSAPFTEPPQRGA